MITINSKIPIEISLSGFNLITSKTRKIPNSKQATFFPIDRSVTTARGRRRRAKIRLKFDGISTERSSRSTPSGFVLEPLAPRTRARTSVAQRYSNQLPAVRGSVRADARTPSSSSGRICAFSSCEFPSQARFCLSRIVAYEPTHQTGRVIKGKLSRLPFTYREYIVISVIASLA